jgi:DNA-binding transcriptional regulator YiaG
MRKGLRGMTKRFSTLRAKMPPRARTRSRQRAEELLRAMPLNELRRTRHMTQGSIASAMQTSQSEVSKLEQRTDTYVSTLQSYVRALGGELDIVARFPDGCFRISQFRAD